MCMSCFFYSNFMELLGLFLLVDKFVSIIFFMLFDGELSKKSIISSSFIIFHFDWSFSLSFFLVDSGIISLESFQCWNSKWDTVNVMAGFRVLIAMDDASDRLALYIWMQLRCRGWFLTFGILFFVYLIYIDSFIKYSTLRINNYQQPTTFPSGRRMSFNSILENQQF